MTGYIGERARRRRRNFILFFIFIFLILIFYSFLPLFKLSDVKPTDNLLPSDQEIMSPEINTTLEELELKVFDKEQKIIFRNKQIEKFKDEITIISTENQKLLDSIKDLNSIVSSSSNIEELIKGKDKLIKKIKNDQINELKKLKNTISHLKTENKEILKEIEKFKYENNSITKKFKSIFSKNLKLKNLNEENNNKIFHLEDLLEELEDLVEEQNLIIQLLKDKNPHG